MNNLNPAVENVFFIAPVKRSRRGKKSIKSGCTAAAAAAAARRGR